MKDATLNLILSLLISKKEHLDKNKIKASIETDFNQVHTYISQFHQNKNKIILGGFYKSITRIIE